MHLPDLTEIRTLLTGSPLLEELRQEAAAGRHAKRVAAAAERADALKRKEVLAKKKPDTLRKLTELNVKMGELELERRAIEGEATRHTGEVHVEDRRVMLAERTLRDEADGRIAEWIAVVRRQVELEKYNWPAYAGIEPKVFNARTNQEERVFPGETGMQILVRRWAQLEALVKRAELLLLDVNANVTEALADLERERVAGAPLHIASAAA